MDSSKINGLSEPVPSLLIDDGSTSSISTQSSKAGVLFTPGIQELSPVASNPSTAASFNPEANLFTSGPHVSRLTSINLALFQAAASINATPCICKGYEATLIIEARVSEWLRSVQPTTDITPLVSAIPQRLRTSKSEPNLSSLTKSAFTCPLTKSREIDTYVPSFHELYALSKSLPATGEPHTEIWALELGYRLLNLQLRNDFTLSMAQLKDMLEMYVPRLTGHQRILACRAYREVAIVEDLEKPVINCIRYHARHGDGREDIGWLREPGELTHKVGEQRRAVWLMEDLANVQARGRARQERRAIKTKSKELSYNALCSSDSSQEKRTEEEAWGDGKIKV